jgi:hypothetical protein
MPRKYKARLVVEIRDEDMEHADYLRTELPKLALLVLRELRRRRAAYEQLVTSFMGDAMPRRIDMQQERRLSRRAHRLKAARREQARRRGRRPRKRGRGMPKR